MDNRLMYELLMANGNMKDIKQELHLKHQQEQRKSVSENLRWTYIIVPHPDNEILCCSRKIRELKADNKPLKIIYLTDGEGLKNVSSHAALAYAQNRRQDSIDAMKAIGVDSDDLMFLGFPDSHLADLNEDRIISSSFTQERMTGIRSYRPHKLYSIQNLWRVLGDIFIEFPPKIIYMPVEHSGHLDHAVVKRTVFKVLEDRDMMHDVHFKGYAIYAETDKTPERFPSWKRRLMEFLTSKINLGNHRQFLEGFAEYKEVFVNL